MKVEDQAKFVLRGTRISVFTEEEVEYEGCWAICWGFEKDDYVLL